MKKLNCHCNFDRYVLIFFLVLGIFLRVYEFGENPCGLNQDEAFAGYEAFSLLNYGIDSAGYRNPTYFVSWGSGMNVLESYLAIPFVWLFGNTPIAIRMPMLICSILSLPVLYLLVNEIYDRKTALFAMAVLSVCPWHVMLSRWGLESNLAPAFLLFGLFFLVKGFKNNKFWPLAALMYGLSLYSYAITWIVVPLTLLAVFAYMLFCRYKFSLKYFALSVLILFVLACPHILFLLINMDVIPEIRTNLFSIPRLVEMRESEVTLQNIISPKHFARIIRLLFGDGDRLIWNTFEGYNLYYKISIPFLLVGFLMIIKTSYIQVKNRKIDEESVIWMGILCSCFITMLISDINVNKANHIHIYMIVLIALGMRTVMQYFSKRKRILMVIVSLIYGISLWNFASAYFQTYNEKIAVDFCEGVQQCIDSVNLNGDERVNVDDSIFHSQVLYFDKTATPQYIQTRKYLNYPNAYLKMESFTKYTFDVNYEEKGDFDAYIVPTRKLSYFSEEEYNHEIFGVYAVVRHKA